ncbi:MAG: response regulator [Pseudomonadota bacterium]
MYRVLLLDDEENILSALRRSLKEALPALGIQVCLETFNSPATALQRVSEQAFDLAISDYRMPEMNGVEFLKRLRAAQPGTARIILSGYADHDALLGAINEAGIARFLEKPWDSHALAGAVREVLQQRDRALEIEHLADEMRVQRGTITPQDLALKRLEEESPAITKVNWGPDGSVRLDDLDDFDGFGDFKAE